jgi:hypothetical protein
MPVVFEQARGEVQRRVRHYTSREGLRGIRRTMTIFPARAADAGGEGVYVERQPFGPARTGAAETGSFGKEAYVEFDEPPGAVTTNVGPRYTAVIPTQVPLDVSRLEPEYVEISWWKWWLR